MKQIIYSRNIYIIYNTIHKNDSNSRYYLDLKYIKIVAKLIAILWLNDLIINSKFVNPFIN
jgi:hypothetical protein